MNKQELVYERYLERLIGAKVIKVIRHPQSYQEVTHILQFDNGLYLQGLDGEYGDDVLEVTDKLTDFTKRGNKP